MFTGIIQSVGKIASLGQRGGDMRIGIVGAGLSGLATAFYLQRQLPGVDLVIFEAEPRPGGALHTVDVQGFRFEAGGNGFLTNKPDCLQLVQDRHQGPQLFAVRLDDGADHCLQIVTR